MQQTINNVCAVDYGYLTDVGDFKASPLTGSAEVISAWRQLLCGKDISLTISESHGKAGRSFETSFSCTMKSLQRTEELVLVRITLSTGEQLLIGDLDLPVRMLQDHSLQSKRLTFSHTSWHYPFRLV